MKLSEYGLFTGEKVVASKEEQDIYKALGLPFIEPAHRTGDLPA
jgi:DNA polymerase (family 10)